jgi:Fe2+ transport system protein B
MGDGDDVTRGDCKDFRNNCSAAVLREIREVGRISEKRLDAHADQLDRQDRLMERVVTIQEQLAEQSVTAEKRLQLLEKQVALQQQSEETLQKEVASVQLAHQRLMAQQQIKEEEKEKTKSPIWKEKWFGICMIIILLIIATAFGAAMGQNIFSGVEKLPK